MNTWRTLPSGALEVNGAIPRIVGGELDLWRRKVGRWTALADASAKRHGVPVHWVLGLITAESYGDPGVVSADGGHGLMQLTHPTVFGGHAPAATLGVPGAPLNIDLGSRHLAKLRTWGGKSWDLPAVASMYNAGQRATGPHPSASSPWGYRETKGHIDRAVRGANTALAERAPPPSGTLPGDGDALRTMGLCLAVLKLAKE